MQNLKRKKTATAFCENFNFFLKLYIEDIIPPYADKSYSITKR